LYSLAVAFDHASNESLSDDTDFAWVRRRALNYAAAIVTWFKR